MNTFKKLTTDAYFWYGFTFGFVAVMSIFFMVI